MRRIGCQRVLRVLGKETGRLLSVRSLVLVGALAVVFFFVFMEYYCEFDHSHSSYEEYDIARRMVNEYGRELSGEEFADFEGWIAQYEAECGEWIAGNPIFEAAGVYSYADYEALRDRENRADMTPEEKQAIWALLDERCGYARFYVQAHEELTGDYRRALQYASDTDLLPETPDARLAARRVELYSSDEYTAIYPSVIDTCTERYLSYLAVLCVLSVMLVCAPAAVTDRVTGVDALQHTSRHGRWALLTKMGGAAAASLAVAAAEMAAATAILLASSGCYVFWGSRMDSFMSSNPCFSTATFGAHYLGSLGLILLLSLAAGLLTCLLSSLSRSMVSVILKLLPLFVALTVLCDAAVSDRGTFANSLYGLTGIPCAPLLCALLLLAATVTLCGLHISREMKRDA